MNVISLFDGCGMALQALKNIGKTPDTYMAFEIDKYATAVCRHQHGDWLTTGAGFPSPVLHMGNVLTFEMYRAHNTKATPWDLIIGGSPCQDLSPLKNGGTGLAGMKSSLFWRYVEFVRYYQPRYFVLENVGRMKKADAAIISKELGVEPIRINSNLFSAQNRDRLYWTNINVPALPQTENINGIHDVLLSGGNVFNNSLYLTNAYVKFLSEGTKWNWKFEPFNRDRPVGRLSPKAKCLTANYYKMARSDNYIKENFNPDDWMDGGILSNIRKLHPIECERLQRLPEDYTANGIFSKGDGRTYTVNRISNTQRYKMIGNGFTVKVIEHILKGM